MEILIGYTGFVGSNLNMQHKFKRVFNSKNIEESFNLSPDLCVYAGVYAEKFLANSQPEKDKKNIESTILNIKNINPKKLVLISTIDIYKDPFDVDEDSKIETQDLHPYGLNRYYLEEWVKGNIKDHLIIRLPGLYGKNLKKNFLYDLINIIPSMLTKSKYEELTKQNILLSKYYKIEESNFYKFKNTNLEEKNNLKDYFNSIGFSAINFTDSKAKFQFYNLSYLWDHIKLANRSKITLLNLATEPILAEEIYKTIKKDDFVNNLKSKVPNYDVKTKFYKIFKGKDGYIFSKDFILDDIKKFAEGTLNETIDFKYSLG